MDVLQSIAVVAANAAMPGSGILVNGGFDLLKVCIEIAQVLSGMEQSASSVKAQHENIEGDVEEFSYMLELLNNVTNKHTLSEGLQKTILQFESDVKEYDRVMAKFKKKTLVKQLIFHADMDAASVRTKKTIVKLKERLGLECSIDSSSHRSHPPVVTAVPKNLNLVAPSSPAGGLEQRPASPITITGVVITQRQDKVAVFRSPSEELKLREKRYMAQVDSQEVVSEMADVDTQKEILALLKHVDKRHGDPVVSVIKEKLRSSSSTEVKNEVNSLPRWFLTEDQVDIDETHTLGFGGNAKIYRGELLLSKKKTATVAVKISNAKPKRRPDKSKQKFVELMELWHSRLRHRNICKLYGACYLTKTPFVVMELCGAGPLNKFLRQHESDRSAITFELLYQAAQGVLKMHCSGVVHGDLKCDNILVMAESTGAKTSTWQAKVSDFDRSFDWNALKKAKKNKAQRLEDMAAAGFGIKITGAVPWLAPECVQGRLPSPASDVYSFGMTMYQALTGKFPYYHINSDEALRKCKLEHRLPLREAKLIKGEVWELIKRTSQPEPFKRPVMLEVMKALKALKAMSSEHQKQQQPPAGESDEVQEEEVATSVPAGPDVSTGSPHSDADHGRSAVVVESQLDGSTGTAVVQPSLPEIGETSVAISIPEAAGDDFQPTKHPSPDAVDKPEQPVSLAAQSPQHPTAVTLDRDRAGKGDQNGEMVLRARKSKRRGKCTLQ